MTTLLGCLIGFIIWFLTRYLVGGLYTVNQNERAVKTSFGRAQRVATATTLDDPISDTLSANQRERYSYPQVRVIQPGGPYFKWPWETVHKVSIATETVNIGWDPEDARANNNGTMLEAVTKDQLNTGLTGQLRFRVAERNLYAYLFGIKRPYAHTMGYFVSVLRERIANFEAPPVAKGQTGGVLSVSADGTIDATAESASVIGISINDLRWSASLPLPATAWCWRIR
jgi:regulator of protease activity HflC (stomatin/prohibitin superfamily)